MDVSAGISIALSSESQQLHVSSASILSSSTKSNLPSEDDQAASSLLRFFNQLTHTNSHQNLVKFVEDVQKSCKINRSSRVASAPDLLKLQEHRQSNGHNNFNNSNSHGLRKRNNSEVVLEQSGEFDKKRIRDSTKCAKDCE